MRHEILDQIKLAQHRLIAKKLQENPERILSLARRNLHRFIKGRSAPATSLWREWRSILEQDSIDRIVAVMMAKTQKATELRQASPFAGALSQEEIARTIQREKERARARYGTGVLECWRMSLLVKRPPDRKLLKCGSK